MVVFRLFFVLYALVVPSLAGNHHKSNSKKKDHSKHKRPVVGIIPSEDDILSFSPTEFAKANPCSLSDSGTTTTTKVPELFRETLREYSTIDEKATDYLPAEVAVRKMEKEVGWDLDHFSGNKLPIENLMNEGITSKSRIVEKTLNNIHLYMDIVIPVHKNIEFLDVWRPYLEGFHLILVQDGDPDRYLKIPSWADYELYNRRDIDVALAHQSWIIRKNDASLRDFGFLVSHKTFIYTFDEDCQPVVGPDGKVVNPIIEHARNLISPSTPFFFNTVYDPYRDGSDFVRGFPYSLRAGVATAVSHGLWMHNYDYDAPTQLLKVDEKNDRYVDATLTVPKGVLYSLSSRNLAFNRELIGPTMMQGLVGEGQPWAHFGDIWAGWASKTVADHMGVGTKSGHPYIKHNKPPSPFKNLYKEYKSLEWQESVIRFFDTVELSDETKTDVGEAYYELSWRLDEDLGQISEYFKRLGLAIRTWVEVWGKSQKGIIVYVPSRRSDDGPKAPHRAAREH